MRGELLKNNVAESNRNGVVGRIGRKMPIIPRANDMNPKERQTYFTPAKIQ